MTTTQQERKQNLPKKDEGYDGVCVMCHKDIPDSTGLAMPGLMLTICSDCYTLPDGEYQKRLRRAIKSIYKDFPEEGEVEAK
jgi:hypothetical protein